MHKLYYLLYSKLLKFISFLRYLFFLLAPRFAPTLKNLTAFSSTAVIVEWFPINATFDVVTGYLIIWQREGHRQNGTENVTNASTSSSVIDGLRKYTNYSVKIAAYNSVGVGPYSETTLVQTGPDGKEHLNM